MKSKAPNAILLGAQKSGTTAMFDGIGQHPDVWAPASMQDFPLFGHAASEDRSGNWIEKQCRGINDESISLHGFSHYLYFSSDAASEIFDYNSETKLLAILRNPVERAFSAYLYALRTGRENSSVSFEEAIERELRGELNRGRNEMELSYVGHGFYGEQLENYLRHFPREQIFVVLYDDLVSRPERLFHDIFSFLGVDADYGVNIRQANPYAVARSRFLKDVLSNRKIPTVIRNIVPLSMRIRLRRWLHAMNARPAAKPQMEEKTRIRLQELYEDDLCRLERLIGRDFSNWRANY